MAIERSMIRVDVQSAGPTEVRSLRKRKFSLPFSYFTVTRVDRNMAVITDLVVCGTSLLGLLALLH